MTTFASLKSTIATTELRDPSARTFSAADCGDLINSALAEIGRIAPQQYTEDLTPVADALSYQLRADIFTNPEPDLRLVRVELWDGSQTPAQPLMSVEAQDASYVRYSESGWKVWNGTLELPRWVPVYLADHEADYLIRVWGYSPYIQMVDDGDIIPVSTSLERAMRSHIRMEALLWLASDRNLFTQWQTSANNSDISPAQFMNEVTIAQEAWRRLSRSIAVLRVTPS